MQFMSRLWFSTYFPYAPQDEACACRRQTSSHDVAVLHCNGPNMLGAVVAQTAAILGTPAATGPIAQALSSHDAMMTISGRHNLSSVGAWTWHFSQAGFPALAKRVHGRALDRAATLG